MLIIYALDGASRGAGSRTRLVAAALIALGVLVPLDVPGTDFANFVGYILWSIWMVVFAVLIWRRPVPIEGPAAQPLAA